MKHSPWPPNQSIKHNPKGLNLKINEGIFSFCDLLPIHLPNVTLYF